MRLGALVRVPADLADPVLSAGPEGYPPGVVQEYYAFVAASLDKIPVVLDDPAALKLKRGGLPAYWQKLLARSREPVGRHPDRAVPERARGGPPHARLPLARSSAWPRSPTRARSPPSPPPGSPSGATSRGDLTRIRQPAIVRAARPAGHGPHAAAVARGERGPVSPRRAILSVYRKDGIVDLARGLVSRGFEIVSTGGTAEELRKAGVPVVGVSETTGFPEILDGRVKTLHPKIHGGILARRDEPAHIAALEGARHRPRRRGGGEPLPVRGQGREGRVLRRGPGERRHRRAHHAAGGGQELPARGGGGGPGRLPAGARAARPPGRHRSRHAALPRAEGVPPHRALRGRHRGLFRPGRGEGRRLRGGGVGRRLPLSPEPLLREGPGPALRREPAPARGLLQRPRLHALLRGRGAQAAGQGALVQQHPRPGRGLAPGHRVPRARLRDREAHQPLRHRGGGEAPRGLRARLGVRPALGLRRHRGPQPPRGRGHGAEARVASSWRR